MHNNEHNLCEGYCVFVLQIKVAENRFSLPHIDAFLCSHTKRAVYHATFARTNIRASWKYFDPTCLNLSAPLPPGPLSFH